VNTDSHFRSAETGIVTTLHEWDKVYAPWVAILESQSRLPISVDPRWLFHWWKYFAENKALRVCWAAMGNEVIAILPMMLKSTGNKRILSFLSDCCSDYLGGIFSSAAYDPVERIVTTICEELDWDEIELQNIRQDDNTLHIIMRALQSCGLTPIIRKCDEAPFIQFDESWDNYLASRSHNRRAILRKKTRRLLAAGRLEFQVLRDYNEEVIEQLLTLHDARWEKMHSVQAFADSRRRGFIHDVARDFAQTGSLCVFLLILDGAVIAYRLGFIRGDVYYDWNTSFDTALARYSPGLVLIGKAIHWACEHKLKEFDFMRGYEQYKLSWNTGVRLLYSIVCCRQRTKLSVTRPVKSVDTLKALGKKRGVILDLDGVVYQGSEPIESTIRGIQLLQKKGILIGFLTNTSVKTQEEIVEKLAHMCVVSHPRYIMTSTIAAAEYCKQSQYNTCMVIGGAPALPQALIKSGCRLVLGQTDDDVDALVVGYTKEFSYADLLNAQIALLRGAAFICTDRDRLFAAPKIPKPGTGWIVAAIETVSEVTPFIAGKPNDFSLQLLLRAMKLDPREAVVVGDSLDADIVAAKKAGVLACLLVGGISTSEDAARRNKHERPDLVFSDFMELARATEGG